MFSKRLGECCSYGSGVMLFTVFMPEPFFERRLFSMQFPLIARFLLFISPEPKIEEVKFFTLPSNSISPEPAILHFKFLQSEKWASISPEPKMLKVAS